MTFGGKTIIYVTREIERALGTEPGPSYRIVTNRTTYGELVHKQYPDFITLIDPKGKDLLGTGELLAHPETRALVERTAGGVLVFKNTPRVEAAFGGTAKLLNPPSVLAERVENKVSQVRWLGELGTRWLPPHAVKVAKHITWKDTQPFIVQWAHGHTGDGTILIHTPEELRAIQEKFPERIARVSAFIQGPTFTVNAVVANDRVLVSNPSYQITGLKPFTDRPFATVGNDWGLAKQLLGPSGISTLQTLTTDIGARLHRDGWRGLFGVDVVKDETTGRIYLIEINARQPASTTFESLLQAKARAQGASGLTAFEAHLQALLGLPIEHDLIEIPGGAQIVQRVTADIQSLFDDAKKTLETHGYDVISYQNTDPNDDLLRIQSSESIMEAAGTLNSHGRDIATAIKSSHLTLKI